MIPNLNIEEKKEYQSAKNMRRNGIITILIMVILITIVMFQEPVTIMQSRCKNICFVLSGIVILISLIAIIEKDKIMKDLKKK